VPIAMRPRDARLMGRLLLSTLDIGVFRCGTMHPSWP
jgi:hypothetical protein